jgi:hypothetical protein
LFDVYPESWTPLSAQEEGYTSPVGWRVTGMIPHWVMQKTANGHRKKVGTVYRYGSQDYYYSRNRNKVLEYLRSSLRNH